MRMLAQSGRARGDIPWSLVQIQYIRPILIKHTQVHQWLQTGQLIQRLAQAVCLGVSPDRVCLTKILT